jgi:hypothetical protein
MMFRRTGCLLAVLGMACWATPGLAETIELTNGDVISGDVVERNDSATVVDSPVLGRVTIANDQIKTASAGLDNEASQAAQQTADWIDNWFFPGWK